MVTKESTNKPEITIQSFTEKDVLETIKSLEEITSNFLVEQPILIRIDSYGGSIYGLSMLYEYLMSVQHPKIIYTTSKAMPA